MNQSIWGVTIGDIAASDDDAARGRRVIDELREARAVEGNGPEWHVLYDDLKSGGAALDAARYELDAAGERAGVEWTDVLRVYLRES